MELWNYNMPDAPKGVLVWISNDEMEREGVKPIACSWRKGQSEGSVKSDWRAALTGETVRGNRWRLAEPPGY